MSVLFRINRQVKISKLKYYKKHNNGKYKVVMDIYWTFIHVCIEKLVCVSRCIGWWWLTSTPTSRASSPFRTSFRRWCSAPQV